MQSARLKHSDFRVRAANGTVIPILGTVRLAFTVNDTPHYADFLVTKATEEIMLGIDWLSDNACQWHFDNKAVTFMGRTVRLLSRQSNANIRRIYVEETVVLPPGTQVNVPVHLTWNSLKAPQEAEPRQFKKGLFSARTLLSAV